MKKGLVFAALVACIAFFSGCIKNGTSLTINPYMTASLGTYTFNAETITPSVTTPQLSDSTTILTILGDQPSISNKMKITIMKYKGLTGTFSIIQGQAAGVFYHNGITSVATSGIVAISNIGVNTITGYYSFTTSDGVVITQGTFEVGKPWAF